MLTKLSYLFIRRRKGVYGPAMGKKIILAFDDFEVSAKDNSPSQNSTELLRQLLEYRYWYDLEDASRIDLIDFVSNRFAADSFHFVLKTWHLFTKVIRITLQIFTGIMTAAMNTISNLSPRFVHHTNIIYSKPFDETTISSIFTAVLDWHFQNKGFAAQISRQSRVNKLKYGPLQYIV